jgi:DNA-binding NarL/FixJ family response regulator
VFALVGAGKTNQEIAAALGISLNTVKLHVSAILRRLGLASRTQIVLRASRAQE